MKPLLAEKVDLDHLRLPYLTSVKVDGFRCLIHDHQGPVTRSIKPIPNNYVRGKLQEWGLRGLDGELVTLTNGKVDDFNTVQSKLSTRGGMPDFRFMVFDCFTRTRATFEDRLAEAVETVKTHQKAVGGEGLSRVTWLEHQRVESQEELLAAEEEALAAGWEGLMLRDPFGHYKFGRSTVKENILLKLKRLDDSEGIVVGVQERMHNANEATESNLGYKERSSHKANMVPTDSLGALKLKWRDVEFDVGTGFSEQQRQALWKEDLVGKVVTFQYQGVGSGGRPRFPRFKGFRSTSDL
jgi:DNA ligase 1